LPIAFIQWHLIDRNMMTFRPRKQAQSSPGGLSDDVATPLVATPLVATPLVATPLVATPLVATALVATPLVPTPLVPRLRWRSWFDFRSAARRPSPLER
jgi:hypothetical protein